MIIFNEVSKKYANRSILNKFSIEIKKGTFNVIHGKSGSGKSTLLNIMGLIESFDAGNIELFSEINPKPNTRKATLLRRNHIAYLFQNFALIDSDNIFHNLAIAQEYQKRTKKQKIVDQQDVLVRLGMRNKLSEKVYMLSGGEKQRIALARVLLKGAELILADEPTASVDSENRDLIIQILQEEVQKGRTVVIASHDPEIILKSENRINLDVQFDQKNE